jgi:hypothetical protein
MSRTWRSATRHAEGTANRAKTLCAGRGRAGQPAHHDVAARTPGRRELRLGKTATSSAGPRRGRAQGAARWSSSRPRPGTRGGRAHAGRAHQAPRAGAGAPRLAAAAAVRGGAETGARRGRAPEAGASRGCARGARRAAGRGRAHRDAVAGPRHRGRAR